MSKFIGRRFIGGGGGLPDGYDHGALSGLDDDDHLQYLITSAIRVVDSPTSGISKTGAGSGDVFTLENAGSGAALFIKQTATTTDADAALDVDNTGNEGRGLSVFSSTADPTLPLVQFSALDPNFDEPVLLLTHAGDCGLALEVQGDAYIACQVEVGQGLVLNSHSSNPFSLGDSGIYVKDGEFYYVDAFGNERTWTVDTGGGGVASDGYFPFVEVDEVEITGSAPGELENDLGFEASAGALIRREYNSFLIGGGDLEIRGLTLRSPVDDVIVPEITFDVYRDAVIVDASQENTVLSNGILVKSDCPTTEVETFDGTRKDGEILFTTGSLDFTTGLFGSGEGDGYDGYDPCITTGSSDGYDGYMAFVFKADHTLDTKTILVERRTGGPTIEDISFEYPTCAFTGSPQTAIRNGQTFDITVTTSTDPSDSQAVSLEVLAGGAIQSAVFLSEGPAGTWTGTVTASTTQGNGLAAISVRALDLLANPTLRTTTSGCDDLVLFDNDFPVIETYQESLDIVYPDGQSCLKFGETADAYMSVSDFTEILYSSPNGRFTIDDPTVYETQKTFTWDSGSSGIEENANILGGLPTTNFRIRARKSSNCSETIRNMQIRLDDTPPRITSIRWTTNCSTGTYDETEPVLGLGTHDVRFIFDDPLVELPTFDILDGYKGTLGSVTGTVPGTTFFSTVTIDGSDTEGCTELVLLSARNCSNKQPLDADPIDGTDEVFCVDISSPDIARVEIDVDDSDGYFNDGYDGYNQNNDDVNNTDNTEQACEVNFSSAVQSITARDVLTRHDENVTVTVEMNDSIPNPADFNAETCEFDASPWGGGTVTLPKFTNYLFQGTFTTDLGSPRTDDQGEDIGRASIWHATGNDATVEDTACNDDTETNTDILSANGIDNIGTEISFATDGTATPSFKVATGSFRAFMPGRKVRIVDDNTAATIRTVTDAATDGTITVTGSSLAAYTIAQNARAVPLSATQAEVAAWDTSNGLVAYVDDGAFTQICVCDWANPEAFSQHLTNDHLTQNNSGTVGVDLFRAAFWGSKLSVPNTNGGTEANPTGVANATYVWRSKKMRLTTNPTGVQGSNLRFMLFGFLPDTTYRNVPITSTSDWDTNSSRYDLTNNHSQIDIRISVDEPFAAIQPLSVANWYDVTDFRVSPQSGFKFGKSKDIDIVFNSPATDVIDQDIYIEIVLYTDSNGKAPQVDLFSFAFLA